MPTVLTETLAPPAPQNPARKRWTREQCATLESSGIWDQERLELVDGELLSKMGKKRAHVHVATRIQAHLTAMFGTDHVNVEAPIDVAPGDLAMNEPVPDLIVLQPRSEELDTNPQPSQLLLVVEIADSSVRFDLTVKAALYARAEIVEYWVLDVSGRRLIVHRDPSNGIYRSVTLFNENESAKPLAASGAEIAVSAMLPAFR